MSHSTLGVSDCQFLQAFRELLPARRLQQAVAATSAVRRRRRCVPAPLVLGGLIAWLIHGAAKLPGVLGWLCRRPGALPSDSALYQARASLGWRPLRSLCRRVL